MLKKNSRLIFILLLLLCSSAFTFGQTNTAKIDFGSIENSVYRHKYFGLKVTIPQKWHVVENEDMKRAVALLKQSVVDKNKQLEQGLDASLLNTIGLLTVFKYPPNSGVASNPAFACLAEKNVPSLTGKDYLMSMKSLMQQANLPFKFEREVYSQVIGGKEFAVLPVQGTSQQGLLVNQNYYAIIVKGYALAFIITYHNAEDLKLLEGMLKSVKFRG
jgi:hypothetical protein